MIRCRLRSLIHHTRSKRWVFVMMTFGNIIRKDCGSVLIGTGISIRSPLSLPKTEYVMRAMNYVNWLFMITHRSFIKQCVTGLRYKAISGGAPGIISNGTLVQPCDLDYMNAIL